ncbi:MAG: polysaccharide biosynthesis C-terminal domain-containing protein [Chloroflexota bacterium]
MTRRSFSTDVALLTGVRLGSVGAGFLTSVLAARLLGAAGLGAAAVAITIGTLSVLLANGGLGITSIYFLGRRPEERTAIVNNLAAMTMVSVIVATLLMLAFIPPTLALVLPGHPPGVLIAAAVLAPVMVAADVGGATLLGLHARGRYMGLEAIRNFGTLAATALVLGLGARTEEAYVLAVAGATAVAAVVAWDGVIRVSGSIHPRFDGSFVREALSMGIRGQAGNVLQFVNLRLDLLLVSALLRVEAAGVYLVALRVGEVVVQVANSFAVLTFPQVASQADPNDTASTERATRVTLAIVAVSAVGLGLVAEPLLTIAFGEAFRSGTVALRVLLLGMVPLALCRIVTSDLKGRGRADLASIANLLAVVLTAVLGLLLIPAFGIEGAAMASVGAYAGLAVALLVAYRHVTRGQLRHLVPRLADARLIWAISRRGLR